MLKRHVDLENDLPKHHDSHSAKQGNEGSTLGADGELSFVQQLLSLDQISLEEFFSNRLNDFIDDLLHVLLASESLLIHELQEFLVHDIIVNRKVCLNEFPNDPKSWIITC